MRIRFRRSKRRISGRQNLNIREKWLLVILIDGGHKFNCGKADEYSGCTTVFIASFLSSGNRRFFLSFAEEPR